MTHEAHTPPLPPASVATGQVAESDVMDRVDAALEGLWHLLTSMRAAMVLIMVLALMALAGSLLIQIPGGMADDAASRSQWLDSVRPMYGGWVAIISIAPGVVTLVAGLAFGVMAVLRARNGEAFGGLTFLGGLFAVFGVMFLLLDPLGLFNIFTGLPFRVLVAILAISLIACTVHRIPGAWRTATKPRIDVGPGFFEHAPQREQIAAHGTSAETVAAVQGVLRKHHYRILTTDDGSVHLYADRYRFMAFASLAGHLSLVLILAGAIIGTTFGYRNSQFVVAEGASLPTGTEPGLSLKLIDFTDTWYTTVASTPSDYASQVELYKDGVKVAAQTIRVNEPLSYNGATYYQSSYGSAAVMTVKDASGKVVFDGGVPLDLGFGSENRAGGIISIPGSSDQIYVLGTTGTSDTEVQPGQVLTELVSTVSNTSVDQGTVDQGKTRQLGTYSVTFSRESQYTLLTINRDPGQILIWLGALMLFGGFTLIFLLPQRRVWARISTRGSISVLSIASLGRRDAALGTDFEALVTDIRTALQSPAQA